MKSKFVVVVIVVCIILFVGNALRNVIKPPKKYNLIIISFDALTAQHLHSYGYPLNSTPNLDAFLKESYVFTNAVSPAPWTVPSHMAIFTSMYPSENKVVNKYTDWNLQTQKGVITNLQKLSPNAVTLAQILQKAGYVTGGFTGDSGVGKQFGFAQGFDTYYDAAPFGGFDLSVPRALSWLKQNKDKPFFLFLHGYDIHGQHVPNGGYDYRYVTKPYTGIYTGSVIEQAKLREQALADGSLNMSAQDIAFWKAVYDEKINRTDGEFKNFLDQIQKMGLLDNTVVVLMSDHGEEFLEHNGWDHGDTLYSELINVLFAIHEPGQKQGTRVNQLVSTFDILPTVLDLLHIQNPVPKQTKGMDLTPVFSGKDVGHDVYSETDYRLYTFKRSIQTPDGWTLILTLENENKELYNITKDPHEQTNLITVYPQKAYELEIKLRQHINATSGQRTGDQLGCSPVYAGQCSK